MVEGGRGEFTIWVNDKKVAEKGWIRYPSNDDIVTAVRDAIAK
jgi:hypothetical protein